MSALRAEETTVTDVVTTAPPLTTPLRVTAWRDYAPGTADLPGMFLGDHEMTEPPIGFVQGLWEAGVRKVVLGETVDVTDEAGAERTVATFCLLRELTAQAVVVDWSLRLGPTGPRALALGHLQPPRTLEGTDDDEAALGAWRAEHYMDRHVWRAGPGFLQIRDRRFGELRRFTVTDPAYVEAVRALDAGVRADAVPAEILAHLEGEELVGRAGEWVWLHAFRHRRWLQAEVMV
jgi:Family of unknown function (DUF5825)